MNAATYRIEGDVHEGTTAELVTFLDDNPGKVRIEINSYGGDATQGAAILAKLGERSRDVTAYIVGVAASAAGLAAMGAGRIVMHNAAHFMIHEPYTWLEGTSDQLRRAADVLDKMVDTYATAYAKATGNALADIKAWMKDETWLTAEEALALNFCDEIDTAGMGEPLARLNPQRFRAVPPEVMRAAGAFNAGKKEETDAL